MNDRRSSGWTTHQYTGWSEGQDSAMTKLQQQYWVTKQTVFRKLGKKEDECVIASDAELDAKLELFKSIQDSCSHLQRIIDRYQERLCSLAQYENEMGRFLKESGKNDKTRAGKMMIAVGKSMSYSGQQRIALRSPLLRLFQEVETFRHRAIEDTLYNVTAMEKARTEYRAALNWMKDISQELDPDTFKQLEKFKKVQDQVKKTKKKFDRQKLDCLEKVDLLSAARCNMFSHALILYQNSMLTFTEKSASTFTQIANGFKGYQHYDFCVVKELTGLDTGGAGATDEEEETNDNDNEDSNKSSKNNKEIKEDKLLELEDSLLDDLDLLSTEPPSSALGLFYNKSRTFGPFMSASGTLDNSSQLNNPALSQLTASKSKPTDNKKPWYDLFAELDPLSNPDAIGKSQGDAQKHNC
ncbi:islet cell autoantigen 1 [Diaphorina citri]|uniref:Islet cell autoantigen 1 n=1 Tax=Diaphorina citri TaxID=121845 RepID=A0A3Q0JH18_DIACI|nr:islet cell autoantigen 1 [Diaphorina citri]